jgi:aspartate/methionine/tyrosine aminotransferase
MRAVDEVVAALAANPGQSHSWLVGEPCFGPPPELVDAFVRAAGSPSFHYPPQDGLPALREVLAERDSVEGHALAPDQVVVTSGAKSGLLALLATVLAPGDELIHPQPCYPAYPAMATRLGARPVPVEERDGSFAGWSEAVASHIGPRTRAVVLASPSNPTGATLDATQASALVELCRDRDIRLICDEAYVDFRFGPDRQTVPADLDPDRTTVVQVRSASKSWAVCGWRVGWVMADVPLAARVARTHASFINPASGPAQTALCALPEVSVGFLDNARSRVANRLAELCSTLRGAGISIERPEGGFYLWLDVTGLIDATHASDAVRWSVDVARRSGIGLWPGEDFGGSGHVRIAVTAPSDTDWRSAVRALTEVLRAS